MFIRTERLFFGHVCMDVNRLIAFVVILELASITNCFKGEVGEKSYLLFKTAKIANASWK